jgi:predicted  nucleic acid-binding Zn-ribbon protein
MAEAPDPHSASPSEPQKIPTHETGELQLDSSTRAAEANSPSSVEPHPVGSFGSLKQPEETASSVDMPWFHSEPDITRAVISKTEEELLSSLSALMRNRVENEKLQRQMTAGMQAIQDAKNELLRIKNQVRSAEDELATRTREHETLRDEISQTQQTLQDERGKHIEHQEAWFKTRQELEDSRRNVQAAASELGETQETGRLMKTQVAELKKEISRLLGERESMLAQIQPIREELDQRLSAREAVIQQVSVLHQHVESLTEEKNTLLKATPEQISERAQLQKELEGVRGEITEVRKESERLRSDHQRLIAAKADTGAELSDVQGRLTSLRFSHAELLEQINQAHQNHTVLQENIKQAGENHTDLLRKISEANQALALTQSQQEEASKRLAEVQSKPAEPPAVAKVVAPPPLAPAPPLPPAPVAKEEPKPEVKVEPQPAPKVELAEPELPLVVSHPLRPVASSWDSYVLESEFFTEETLDAARVAELVTNLPGIEHSLIVQQFGPILANRLPQRLHALFQVPRRDYSLLYDRLPNKVKDYPNLATRMSTYQIGDEFLTLSGAKDAFLAVTHEAPALRPGLPEKIAIVAEELGKMYPGQADRTVAA